MSRRPVAPIIASVSADPAQVAQALQRVHVSAFPSGRYGFSSSLADRDAYLVLSGGRLQIDPAASSGARLSQQSAGARLTIYGI